MKITVIDGQGGSLGNSLVKEIKQRYSKLTVLAIGTNGIATSNMLKAGADAIATGENPVIVACRNSDIIIGPMGILIADALHGEITPKMATAIGQSNAQKIIIPLTKCNVLIAGTEKIGLDMLIRDAMALLKEQLASLDPAGHYL
ncbi:MAG: DUF3842 family protein [Spirochaetia bacterium]|jgi:putative NADH-flavin reductase|nr:DUF3842 family protein [Spirochaetia bacterium]